MISLLENNIENSQSSSQEEPPPLQACAERCTASCDRCGIKDMLNGRNDAFVIRSMQGIRSDVDNVLVTKPMAVANVFDHRERLLGCPHVPTEVDKKRAERLLFRSDKSAANRF